MVRGGLHQKSVLDQLHTYPKAWILYQYVQSKQQSVMAGHLPVKKAIVAAAVILIEHWNCVVVNFQGIIFYKFCEWKVHL